MYHEVTEAEIESENQKNMALWDFPWSRTRCSILNHPAH
jgi:hypothetical protein